MPKQFLQKIQIVTNRIGQFDKIDSEDYGKNKEIQTVYESNVNFQFRENVKDSMACIIIDNITLKYKLKFYEL